MPSVQYISPLYTCILAGLCAPNIANYYKAVVLDQTRYWWTSSDPPSWIQIESSTLRFSSTVVLQYILLKYHPPHLKLSTTMATLRTWSSLVQSTTTMQTNILQLLPLETTSLMSPDLKLSFWIQSDIKQIGDLYNNSLFLSFQELQQNYHIHRNPKMHHSLAIDTQNLS